MAREDKGHLYQLLGMETGSVGYGWPTRYNANYIMLHDNSVKQFTVKYSSYINTSTDYLIE